MRQARVNAGTWIRCLARHAACVLTVTAVQTNCSTDLSQQLPAILLLQSYLFIRLPKPKESRSNKCRCYQGMMKCIPDRPCSNDPSLADHCAAHAAETFPRQNETNVD